MGVILKETSWAIMVNIRPHYVKIHWVNPVPLAKQPLKKPVIWEGAYISVLHVSNDRDIAAFFITRFEIRQTAKNPAKIDMDDWDGLNQKSAAIN